MADKLLLNKSGKLAARRTPDPNRIRIVRIIDRLNVGGPAKHAVWLTSGLNEERFQSFLIIGKVPDGEDDMSYFATAAGVEPIAIPEMSRELGLRDLVVIAKLIKLFFKLKPDVVHTHKSKAGATGRIAATVYKWLTPSAFLLRPRKCRIVHTFHGHIFHSYYGRVKTRFFIGIERMLARLCTDRIVTISPQQRAEINEVFRVGRREQFNVIPLGIDVGEPTRASRSLREEIGAAPDEALVGIVGRLCEVKNHALLLNAASRLLREAQPVRFVIIGDGHLRSSLENEARRLGISDKVSFVGFRDDATSLYKELDVVALTSLNEGTPLTLIEAMNAGRAVAATEVGGVVDILGNRSSAGGSFSVWEHGVTTRSEDVEGFANGLRFLLYNPDLRLKMGQRGQVFVRKHLSRERLLSDVEELYYELATDAQMEGGKVHPPFQVSKRAIRNRPV